MSRVTNVVLHYSLESDKDFGSKRIDQVNTFFEEDYPGFVHVDHPGAWYGGTKALECNLAIGAFNHLFLEDLIEHLKLIDWEDPSTVQLFVLEEDETRFRLINIETNRHDNGPLVHCTVCGMLKKPYGRDPGAAAASGYCGYDCDGYHLEPYAGNLWPGEQ